MSNTDARFENLSTAQRRKIYQQLCHRIRSTKAKRNIRALARHYGVKPQTIVAVYWHVHARHWVIYTRWAKAREAQGWIIEVKSEHH